jgi:hypothetical protein
MLLPLFFVGYLSQPLDPRGYSVFAGALTGDSSLPFLSLSTCPVTLCLPEPGWVV